MTGVRVRIKTSCISTITVADTLFVPAPPCTSTTLSAITFLRPGS